MKPAHPPRPVVAWLVLKLPPTRGASDYASARYMIYGYPGTLSNAKQPPESGTHPGHTIFLPPALQGTGRTN